MRGRVLRCRRQFFPLLLLLAFLALTMEPASAQFREETGQVGEISTRVWQRWPQTASRGWMPIFVELENRGARARDVRIAAENSNFNAGGVTTGVTLAPGERRRVELVVPLVGGTDWRSSFSYSVRIESAGEEDRKHNFGAVGNHANGTRPMMVFSSRLAPAGSAEAWSAEISTASVEMNTPWSQLHGSHVAVSTSESAAKDNVPIMSGTFEEMPSRMEAYSSLSAVVLEEPREITAGSNLEELFAWARLGGHLTLCGDGALEFVRQRPELQPWMEERYLVTEDEALTAYQFGLGRLIVAEGVSMEDAALRNGLREALRDWQSFLPDYTNYELRPREIPGVDDPPYLVFGFFLLLFAILIGPVNFIWVKRTKRPVLLLFTIPLISAAATLLLLGYGVLAQGIDTKQSSTVLALLDQRANRVDLVQRTNFYVGFARRPGRVPGPRTVVAPLIMNSADADFVTRWDVREGAERILSGSYMPVREVGGLVLLSERATRLGLEVAREGGALVATNGFEGAVEDVAICDSRGGYWFARGPVGPGQKVQLEAIETETWRDHRLRWLDEFGPDSLPGTYRVLPDSFRVKLASGSFEDDLGLNATKKGSLNGVIGLLEKGTTR